MYLKRNIFIDYIGDLKLGCLGFESDVNSLVELNKETGSCNYLSPELVKLDSYDNRIDIWYFIYTFHKLLNFYSLNFNSFFVNFKGSWMHHIRADHSGASIQRRFVDSCKKTNHR